MGNRQSLHLAYPFLLKKQFFVSNIYDTSPFTETNLHYPLQFGVQHSNAVYCTPNKSPINYELPSG
jgi:hypothetical protein